MLNARQQRFVDEYLIDLNATQAAIRAGYSAKTARQIGQENLTKPDIAKAIKEHQLKAQKRSETTLDDILNELDENRKAALNAETVQSSAATAATMAKAKLLGFVIEKTELTGKNGTPIQHQVSTIDTKNLTNEQLKAISSITINS